MMFKSATFLTIFLLLSGCGVMNNPDNTAPEAGNAQKAMEVPPLISKIPTDSLIIQSDASLPTTGDGGLEALQNYQLFKTKEEAEIFLVDLNSSIQTLTTNNLATVRSWINTIQNSAIDYQTTNLLFYPIFQSSDCGITESIMIIDNNATITVQPNSVTCDMVNMYHILLYQVDKSIENITIKAFEEGDVVIENL